jgi:hypothetical protein
LGENFIFKFMKNIYFRTGAVIVGGGAIGVLAFGLIESYFNWQEIDNLTTQALDNGHSYSLVIHNDFTNAYTFEVTDDK